MMIEKNVKLSILTRKHIDSSEAGDGTFRLWKVNTMSGDALAPKVTKSSVGMELAV